MQRFAIVGSGPAGMYTVKYLLKALPAAKIDIFEALPMPFGLVRYGVAPDHPEVKNVNEEYHALLGSPSIRYFGNVRCGRDLRLNELSELYSATILCYGCQTERDLYLNINGGDEKKRIRDLKNGFGSREFVFWYNGHPEYQDLEVDLSHQNATIVGQGNVAIDCARILTKSVDELSKTDITSQALEKLAKSQISKVSVVGRRGPVQAAFTIKEVRELTKLEIVDFGVNKHEFEAGMTAESLEVIAKVRAKKRINDLLKANLTNDDTKTFDQGRKQIDIRFLLSPFNVNLSEDRVQSIDFQKQKLIADKNGQIIANAAEPEAFDSIPTDLVISSIGFRGEKLEEDLDFNEAYGVIKNSLGKVQGKAGLFTAGWIKRGPSGIVGTNIVDARQTVDVLVENLKDPSLLKADAETEVLKFLAQRNVDFVDFKKYEAIDKLEIENGTKLGKPREKFTSVEEMLAV